MLNFIVPSPIKCHLIVHVPKIGDMGKLLHSLIFENMHANSTTKIVTSTCLSVLSLGFIVT